MTAAAALGAVLGLLAVYHLAMGALCVASPPAAARLGGALYALEAEETPQLRYGLRMLGLYALALGLLLAWAARDPGAHPEIVAVAGGLQLARAASRLVLRREIRAAFGIPPARNALNAGLLLAQAALLLGLLPWL